MLKLTIIKTEMRKVFRNERGSALLYSMALIFVLTVLTGTLTGMVKFDKQDAYQQLRQTQALYLAEAGMTQAWSEFDSGVTDMTSVLQGADGVPYTSDDGILSFGETVTLGNGSYGVRVTDNDDGDGDVTIDSDKVIRITSTGTTAIGEVSRDIKTYTQVFSPPNPIDVRGAIAAAGPIETLGTLRVDGRDHDNDGFVVPGAGTLGVSTMSTFDQGGASRVGGTNGGTDYSPSKPADPAVIEENADWTAMGGFPDNPDKVVQFEEGTLKTIAQSGIKGSQYVTNPANLTFPLAGVTYVELASGSTWTDIDFGNSSGILVVHNSSTDAIIKNLNYGIFRGLIIADDLVHIHANIIGAIVNLTTAPSEGNCIGNGSGGVRYSSSTIAHVTQVAIGPSVIKRSWFH